MDGAYMQYSVHSVGRLRSRAAAPRCSGAARRTRMRIHAMLLARAR
eukprot:COSAG02_NODE_64957_length_259_cov_0.650000_1_plen_45_part_10